MTSSVDLAIIGAGPAGANAALVAARLGLSVCLLDEQPAPGGQVWRRKSAAILDAPATPETVAGDALRQAVQTSQIRHKGQCRVWQIERNAHDWHLHLFQDGRCSRLQTKALILATGAREFVQPVPGWTTPGVLGLAGATALFKQEMVVPGQSVIVAGTGPLVFFVAAEVRRLGGGVAAVITSNSRRDWLQALPAMLSRTDLLRRGARWMADLMLSGVPIHWNHAVSKVLGDCSVSGIEFRRVKPNGAPVGPVKHIQGDALCMGQGLIPAIEAAQLAGVSIQHRPELGGWIPNSGEDGSTSVAGLFLCGDGAGIRGAAAAEIHGNLAGLKAAAFLGINTEQERAALRPSYARAARFGLAMTALSMPRKQASMLISDDTIICRCESLRRADLALEIHGGANSSNAVKAGSRAGMGACGGKYCQSSIARLIAQCQGSEECDVPPPTARPPLRPVPVTALAGEFNYADLPIPKPAPL